MSSCIRPIRPGWLKWLLERIAKFRTLPTIVRLTLLQVIFFLVVARLALRLVPFRYLTWFFERPPKRPADTFAKRKQILAASLIKYTICQDEITDSEREWFRMGVQWITDLAVWFLPGETVCFPRAIAAQEYLRRLGMGTTLYYGAAILPERGLTAHVWLQDGNQVIVGDHDRQNYHILACYPASPS